MKTLFFCNLMPIKTGAFEVLLEAIGAEFKKSGNEFIVVFAGEPIPPVAESLRAAGVRWCILKGWAERGSSVERRAPSAERVHPWGFVLPALHLLRQERPDVAVVHFGNELPTLVTIFLCRLLTWWPLKRRDIPVIPPNVGEAVPCRDRLIWEPGMNNRRTECASHIEYKPLFQRAPKWVWQQDQQIQNPGRIGKYLSRLRLLSLVADQFVAVYEGGRESMKKRGIPAEKIAVINNSVAPYTPTRPKGWLRRELGEGKKQEKSVSREAAKDAKEEIFFFDDEVLLVTNGSLILRKRIDFILRACAQMGRKDSSGISFIRKDKQESEAPGGRTLCEPSYVHGSDEPPPPEEPEVESPKLKVPRITVSLPPWRFLVIGDGPERERLVALAMELGIAEHVHFLGQRNDVREIMAEADVLLHASEREACCYSILESMEAGIPAVVTDAGAAREQISEGVTGYVVARNDMLGFVERCRHLVIESSLRQSIGRMAHERWFMNYQVEQSARLFLQTYRGVVHKD